MTTACSALTLADRIEKAQHDILDIKRRYFFLAAFVKELDAITRGKPFSIHNDVQWLMLLDCRDMLVLHLASWCKAAYRPGGFFGQLQALHVKDMRMRRRAPSSDPARDRLDQKGLDQAYERLFPGADPRQLQPADIGKLKDAFEMKVAHVVDDRDTNRAHAWENQKRGSAKMLDLTEISAAFDAIERLLNDLRLIATDSTMHSSALLNVAPGVAADDIVDLLLVGTHYRITWARGERRRDEYYAELHRRHDEEKTDVLFNEDIELPEASATASPMAL